jgi:hypothetical protein
MRKISSNKNPSRSIYHASRKERNWGGDGTLICPDSVRVKLPFTQTLTPGTTSGGLYLYQYRGNSGFDPDYTGVGLQPNGFDQWSQFYNTYVVLGSELLVEFIAGTAGVTELVVVPSFNTASAANTKEAAGWRYAKTHLNVTGSNGTYTKVVSQMSTAQICGVPEEEITNDSDFSATVSSSPANNQTWYWNIYVQNVNGTVTLADVLRVTLYLDIKFMAPSQQAFSATRKPLAIAGPCTITAGLPCARGSSSSRLVDDVCCCAACQKLAHAPACNRQ